MWRGGIHRVCYEGVWRGWFIGSVTRVCGEGGS